MKIIGFGIHQSLASVDSVFDSYFSLAALGEKLKIDPELYSEM